MDSDFVVGINKSIDAAKGETGQTYPAYLHNTLVTEKLDELAEAITEGGGGASALSDLTDVDISGTVQGGKVLKYNAVEEKWAPGDDSGNVQSDWNESDPTSGAYILNKPSIPAAQVQSDWNETDTSDPSYIQNKPSIPSDIDDLSDIDLNNLQDGQIIKWDATNSKWVNAAAPSPYTVASDTLKAGITTVTISNAAITANSIIIPCVDEAFTGVAPTAQATAAGSVTLTFPVQSTDMPVKVVVI